jgi:hypothetical protein
MNAMPFTDGVCEYTHRFGAGFNVETIFAEFLVIIPPNLSYSRL